MGPHVPGKRPLCHHHLKTGLFMRVAIDCRYIRERPSGIGAYVEAMVQAIPQMAPEDEFVLWAHRLAARPLTNAPNVSEIRVPVEPNSLWAIWWPEHYASFDGIDLFHAAHNILPCHVPCATVVTIHDLLPIDYPALAFTRWSQRIKRLYYPRAQWRALRHATRLIATTSVMADRIASLCPSARSRVAVVPMAPGPIFGPAPDPERARQRAAEIIGSDAPYFLVVGQNSPTKQHSVALLAFARSVPEPWRLVLVQRQTRKHALANMARRLGVEKRITWIPQIAAADLVALYQAAGVMVQPSLYEGFGLPVVEAMASGCPVVTSDIPTLREVVGTAAILVPPNDIAGFGRALAALARSPDQRRDLANAGIDRAKVFSWDRCARGTLNVFADAAAFGSIVRHISG
jgi:glycosyltransferase involved in cell wall biosynthesis